MTVCLQQMGTCQSVRFNGFAQLSVMNVIGKEHVRQMRMQLCVAVRLVCTFDNIVESLKT